MSVAKFPVFYDDAMTLDYIHELESKKERLDEATCFFSRF